jgi:Flp pilus assembly protein TadD
VLDLDGRSDEALAELRTIVAARPMFGEARYLLGKILLARGAAADALTHLEVAEKLSPDLANVHYQLGQAYQRLGRPELAAREFELFQRLKDKQRGGTP